LYYNSLMEHTKPQSLEELRKLRKPIRNANISYKENLSSLDRFALWITDNIGTMGFFLIVFFWTIVWIAWNLYAPFAMRFDPYPAFVLWLFISNLIQLFLTPLIMVGQNLQSRHAEARAEADFEINTKAEREIENVLLHLEEQDEMILKILNSLEKK
jgi:uncharacterized membrane protein